MGVLKRWIGVSGRGPWPAPRAAKKEGAPIADRGYDGNRFRKALADRGIEACIPGRKNRKVPVEYDKALYKRRNLVERMFGRLKDWRRIAIRYDRCAHTLFSAICIAATVIFWL